MPKSLNDETCFGWRASLTGRFHRGHHAHEARPDHASARRLVFYLRRMGETSGMSRIGPASGRGRRHMQKKPLAGGEGAMSRGMCRFGRQEPLDRFQEGRRIEWFGRKSVAEGPPGALRIPFQGGHSQHEKRDFSRRDVLFQDSGDLESVETRSMKVHEDQIRPTLEGRSKTGFARLGNHERIAVVEKKVSDYFECFQFVFRDQDEFIHFYLFRSPGGAWLSAVLILL